MILKKKCLLDACVLMAYLAINAVMLLRHEPWSDEAAPWLIARDTDLPTFFHILINNYDRHPCLWYILLRPFASLGLPYLSQFILHLALAFTAVIIFVAKAPFSRLTKYLWVFSYFMMYEYALVARPYGLTVALIFGLAALYPRRFQHPWFYAILVFLAFNASYLAFTFGLGLILFYGWELWRAKKPMGAPWFALVTMILGALLAFRQGGMLPPDHVNYDVQLPTHYEKALDSISKAFIPFTIDVSSELATVIALVIVAATAFSFIRKPIPLALLLMSYAMPLYVFVFIHQGDIRHYGFFLVFLLFALWISGEYPELPAGGRLGKYLQRINTGNCRKISLGLVTFCLLISLRATWHAQVMEYRQLFSGAKEMASLVNKIFDQNNLDRQGYVLVAYSHTGTLSLLPYMPERKFWFPYLKSFATYYLNKKTIWAEERMTHDDVIRETVAAFGDLSRVLFLFSREPIQLNENHGYQFKQVAAVYENVFGYTYERFFLYKPIPAASAAIS